MFNTSKVRSHLAELIVVFVGVALAFGVDNFLRGLLASVVGYEYDTQPKYYG